MTIASPPENTLRLILASASPRRADLLRAAGLEFTVLVSPLDEPARKPPAVSVNFWPVSLAYLKAAAVLRVFASASEDQNTLVLAADTIVVLDTPRGPHILNKPANRSHARRMLLRLSGKTHRVITGVCLLSHGRRRLAAAQATCKMAAFTPRRLEAYLDTGLWKGKAGAYGIQDKHDPFVTLLTGDITTVMGLPMPLVKKEIARWKKDLSNAAHI